MVLTACLVPNFSSFGYYFMMDVAHVSQFTYSMLGLVGYVCLFIGTWLFHRFFKHYEMRTLILIDALMAVLFAPIQFMFVFRLNLKYGIADLPLLVFTETVVDTFSMAFIFLPMSVLFAKITPVNIEATCFALLAGVSNFRNTARGWVGSAVNDRFVQVTKDDLSRYWVLVAIQFVCGFLPLLFLWLIPTKAQVDALQQKINEPRESSETDKNESNPQETSATKRCKSPERNQSECELV